MQSAGGSGSNRLQVLSPTESQQQQHDDICIKDDLHNSLLSGNESEDFLSSLVDSGRPADSDTDQLILANVTGGSRRRLSQEIEDHVTRPLRRLLAASRESLGSRGEPTEKKAASRRNSLENPEGEAASALDIIYAGPVQRKEPIAASRTSTNRSRRELDSTNGSRAPSAGSRRMADAIQV
jgi:hypothetical protein